MNREEAWAIVTEYTASDSLRKHMLSVEAGLRAYAPRFNGDADCGAWWACCTTSITNVIPMWQRRAIP